VRPTNEIVTALCSLWSICCRHSFPLGSHKYLQHILVNSSAIKVCACPVYDYIDALHSYTYKLRRHCVSCLYPQVMGLLMASCGRHFDINRCQSKIALTGVLHNCTQPQTRQPLPAGSSPSSCLRPELLLLSPCGITSLW